MTSLFRHLGQKPSKYRYDVLVHGAWDLPVDHDTVLTCKIHKTNRSGGVKTHPATADKEGKVRWFENLTFQSTIFSDPNTNQVYNKPFTVVVKVGPRSVQHSSSNGSPRTRAWAAQVDLAQFAGTQETRELVLEPMYKSRFRRSLSITSRQGKGTPRKGANGVEGENEERKVEPVIKITFESAWMADLKDSEVSEASIMSPTVIVKKERERSEENSDTEGAVKRCLEVDEEGEFKPKQTVAERIIEGEIERESQSLLVRRPADLVSIESTLHEESDEGCSTRKSSAEETASNVVEGLAHKTARIDTPLLSEQCTSTYGAVPVDPAPIQNISENETKAPSRFWRFFASCCGR